MDIIAYLILGFCAGTLSGLLGIGGGIILIPVFIWIFHAVNHFPDAITMHMAIGTSLATIVTTSLASASAHHKRQAVIWKILKILIPGILIGAFLGAMIASTLHSEWLEIIFGCFLIGAAIQLLIPFSKHAKKPVEPPQTIPKLAGVVIGFFSAILGVGGGLFTVPFLTARNIPLKQAIGTSAACALPIGIAGAIGYILMGWQSPVLPPYSAGYVFLPAVVWTTLTSVLGTWLGAHLTHQWSHTRLKKIFAVLLVAVGIKLIG